LAVRSPVFTSKSCCSTITVYVISSIFFLSSTPSGTPPGPTPQLP
jgi:hypothetical protein